jgi:hypothetical protein
MAHAKVLLPYSMNYVKEKKADGRRQIQRIHRQLYVVGSISGNNSYLQHLLASNANPLQVVSYELRTTVHAIALPLESFLEVHYLKFRKCVPRLYLNQGDATKSPHL